MSCQLSTPQGRRALHALLLTWHFWHRRILLSPNLRCIPQTKYASCITGDFGRVFSQGNSRCRAHPDANVSGGSKTVEWLWWINISTDFYQPRGRTGMNLNLAFVFLLLISLFRCLFLFDLFVCKKPEWQRRSGGGKRQTQGFFQVCPRCCRLCPPGDNDYDNYHAMTTL